MKLFNENIIGMETNSKKSSSLPLTNTNSNPLSAHENSEDPKSLKMFD